MSDFVRAMVGLFAALAPFGAMLPFTRVVAGVESGARRQMAAGACLGALGLLALAALAGDPLLEWLDISAENFQLAAACLVLPQAFHLLWRGESLGALGPEGAERGPAVLSIIFPVLAGPGALGMAISYATRFDVGIAVAACAAVLGLTAVILVVAAERTWDRRLIRALAMLNGALLVVIAVEMAVDGVQSV
jgi:small neutral amino acid transporter SnatA (MarC family)